MAPPILLVDDDLSLSAAIASTIEAAGIPVEHCASGELAIELVHTRDYPVAIIDIVLGIGVSGVYVVKAIRQLPASRRPRVLIITGANLESLRGIDRSVVAAVLLKPLNFTLLAEYVLATYRQAVAEQTQKPAQVQTFCGSCKSPLTPWMPDRLAVRSNAAQFATFERWLDTPCATCRASPRTAGGYSSYVRA